MDFLTQFLPALEHINALGYWIAFFAALLETFVGIGLVVPGGTIVLLMGALAAVGNFDVGDLIWFAAAGAMIGDNINYYLGRRYGTALFARGFWFIKKEYFEKGKYFFNKHGGKSVFLGRFFPALKEIVPLVAGTLGMKRWPFFIWSMVGAVAWSLAWILPGYLFAHSLNLAKLWATRAGFFLVALLVFLVILYFLKIFIIRKGKQLFSLVISLCQFVKKTVVHNADVQKIIARHPLFFKFVHDRFSGQKFFGLPFTLLAIAFVYALFLFSGIVEDVVNSDIIILTDVRLANLIVVFRSAELVRFFFWITALGAWQVVLIFSLITMAMLWIWRKHKYIAPFLFVIFGTKAFVWLGKYIFHRPRPETAAYIEASFSFPSGHAAMAIAWYGFITYLCLRHLKSWRPKVNIFFAGVVVILFIGFSRLYLGVHYLSDVWGGYLVGALWLIIGISFSEWLRLIKKDSDFLPKKIPATVITGVLIVISFFLYVIFVFNYQPQLTTELILPEKIIISQLDEIFNDNKLKFTETLTGRQQEPLSFIITAASDQDLISALSQAGWSLADNITFHSVARKIKAAILNKPYPTAPMTPDFWNSQVHSFGFEKATDANTARERRQARFWQTNYVTTDSKTVYVGTVSLELGIKWGLTHRINPNIDGEREFLFDNFQATGMVVDFRKESLVEPRLGQNFTGDLFFTDGEAYFISL